MKKFVTARRVFRTRGIAGIAAVLKTKYVDMWLGKQHNWCYGKLVEVWGNVVTIDGCSFSLDSPAIATKIKSSFLFGEYEKPEREAIRRFLDPSLPVVEFGGSVGVVSCLTNRNLCDPRRHVVVEANRALIPVLEKNRDLNQCQFEILPYMVGYGSDSGTFYASIGNFLTSTSIRDAAGESATAATVKTINLSAVLDDYRFARCTLICDIEGGEADLVRYESAVLKERVSTLMVEVHDQFLGEKQAAEVLKTIGDLGFERLYSESNTYVFANKGNVIRE